MGFQKSEPHYKIYYWKNEQSFQRRIVSINNFLEIRIEKMEVHSQIYMPDGFK